MVVKPGKHKRSKQRWQDLCWKVHDRAQSFVWAHTLSMKYVAKTFLLVNSSVRSKQLSFCARARPKNGQKHTTKIFVGFHNHFPLLTMCRCVKWFARQSSDSKALAIQIQDDVSLRSLDTWSPLKFDRDRILPDYLINVQVLTGACVINFGRMSLRYCTEVCHGPEKISHIFFSHTSHCFQFLCFGPTKTDYVTHVH